MADRLIALLNARIALISTPDSVGTGSFLAPGLVLTCAHVVRNAHKSDSTIQVRFGQQPLTGFPRYEYQAEVVALSDQIDGKEYPDIAILKIQSNDTLMLKLASSQTPYTYLADREYVAIGFQKRDRHLDRDIAQTVSLNYEGEEDAGGLRKIEFENGLVRPGMSGAPLVERSTGEVTGIVQMTRSPSDDLGAYVIPIDKIWEYLEMAAPSLFSDLHTSLHKKEIRKQYRRAYAPYQRLRSHRGRLLALATIIFAGLFWIFYHLGSLQNSGALAALLVSLSILGVILGNWLGAEVASETSALQQAAGQILIHPVTVTVVAVLVATLWFFTSSVWIFGGPEHAGIPLSLITPNMVRTKTLDEQGQAKFLVTTTLFGDTVDIQPGNREPKRAMVQSLKKEHLFYPRDFLLEPLFLLRLDPNYTPLDKYKLEINFDNGNTFLDSTLSAEGAILMGRRPLLIRREREERWLEEIAAGPEIGIPILNQWKKIHPRSDIDLDYGDRFKVTLRKKSDGTVLNQETYSIRDDSVNYEGVVDRLFMKINAEN